METVMNATADQSGTTWSTLERWLAGEISTVALEQWVYGSPYLETILGPDDHLALVSFDYHQAHADIELRRLVLQVYNHHRPGRLARDRARRLATGLVDGTIDLLPAVHALAQLGLEGNDWVPSTFVAIDSDLDIVPKAEQYALWDQVALKSKLEDLQPLIDGCRADAIEAAMQILEGD
jgi:hypothetical protein